MAKNYMKLPKMPKAFNDNNLNSQLPLKVTSSLPSDRLASPAKLAAPKAPTSIDNTDKKARFRRLAGILGGLHKK